MTQKRVPFVVGNWKMNKGLSDARSSFLEFQKLVSDVDTVNSGLSVPAIYLSELAPLARKVKLYAQNSHFAKEGAYTGEISAWMLKELGVAGSIIGHSERRQYFGETSAVCGKRVEALLNHGLEAIYCIGETLEEREAGQLEKVLSSQLKEAFAATQLTVADIIGGNPTHPLLTIAYEPVWAIGTGKTATPKEAQEAHAFVRKVLAEIFGSEAASLVRIQYGGSMKPGNAGDLISNNDIDGGLVGGASLDPETFYKLVTACK